jgi:hypothetical protein
MGPANGPAFPLLEGETESGSLDAAHWANVYSQLVAFCHSVLAEDDVAETLDRQALRRRLNHFEQRRDFWDRQRPFAEGGRSA